MAQVLKEFCAIRYGLQGKQKPNQKERKNKKQKRGA